MPPPGGGGGTIQYKASPSLQKVGGHVPLSTHGYANANLILIQSFLSLNNYVRSHHLSLPLPFNPDLKLISFTNPFLYSHSFLP